MDRILLIKKIRKVGRGFSRSKADQRVVELRALLTEWDATARQEKAATKNRQEKGGRDRSE